MFLLAAWAEKRVQLRDSIVKRWGGLEKRKLRAFPTWILEGKIEATSGVSQKVEPGESGLPGWAGTTS